MIGRDHLDSGSVASPYRETEAMLDGSDAIADWPILNALLNTSSGASWVSVHHGGGVGIGRSIHAGMVVVADGTDEAARKLERVLTNDPGTGVMRHADAGYQRAIDVANERGVHIPMPRLGERFGIWHAEQAWLGHRAENVLIEVENGRIKKVTEGAKAPAGATTLARLDDSRSRQRPQPRVPARSARSHRIGRRGFLGVATSRCTARPKGGPQPATWNIAARVFREMLQAGITAVGEFHYLHGLGNELGEAVALAATQEGIRLTLIDACYLQGGVDGRPLEGAQTIVLRRRCRRLGQRAWMT